MNRREYLINELKNLKQEINKVNKKLKKLDDSVVSERTLTSILLNKPTGQEYYERVKKLQVLKATLHNEKNIIEEELKNSPREVVLTKNKQNIYYKGTKK